MITWLRWWRAQRRTRRTDLASWSIIAGPGIAAAWIDRIRQDHQR